MSTETDERTVLPPEGGGGTAAGSRPPGGSIFDDGIPTAEEMQVIDWLLSTTRSVRKTLDLKRPVPIEVVEECLRVAIQAPTAHNNQRWHWIVVTDQAKKDAIADIYKRTWQQTSGGSKRQGRRWKASSGANEDYDRVQNSAGWLPDHLHEVPVLVVPCLIGPRYDHPMVSSVWLKEMAAVAAETGFENNPATRSWIDTGYFASIYPAVWQFQLALRARGLGSVLTMNHLAHEDMVADILGLPDTVVQTCMLPVAYTTKRVYQPAKRQPLEMKISYNGWQPPR